MSGILDRKRFNTLEQEIQIVFDKLGVVNNVILFDGEGSSNKVIVYEVTLTNGNKKNVAVRVSKLPVFEARKEGGITLFNYNLGGRETLAPTYSMDSTDFSINKEQQESSQYNWNISAEKGLAPDLYFYGYVKQSYENYEGVMVTPDDLYICIINEGYSMDLETYYDTKYTELGRDEQKIINNNISTQLIELFNKMAYSMNMICFDIKPANTVINIENPENPIVKLIDWDSDFCIQYPILRKREGKFQDQASFIMQIIMANFFIKYFKINIFEWHFNKPENKRFLQTNYSSMNIIFCEFKNMHFEKNAIHYFSNFIDPTNNCHEIFTKLFKNATGYDKLNSKRTFNKKLKRLNKPKSRNFVSPLLRKSLRSSVKKNLTGGIKIRKQRKIKKTRKQRKIKKTKKTIKKS